MSRLKRFGWFAGNADAGAEREICQYKRLPKLFARVKNLEQILDSKSKSLPEES